MNDAAFPVVHDEVQRDRTTHQSMGWHSAVHAPLNAHVITCAACQHVLSALKHGQSSYDCINNNT